MATFWLCFVPLFVAVDPVGLLPVYLSLTGGTKPKTGQAFESQNTIQGAG
jgi:multiple antibiotic resistance protein